MPDPTPSPTPPEFKDAWLAGQVPDDAPVDLDEVADALVGALGWPEAD